MLRLQGGGLAGRGLHRRHLPAGHPRRPRPIDPAGVRVLLCSGKVYYDLMAERAKRAGGGEQSAIVRVEQLYPLPVDEIAEAVARYPHARAGALGPGRAGQPGAVAVHARSTCPRTSAVERCPASRARLGLPRCRLAQAARPRAARAGRAVVHPLSAGSADVYFTDRGIEELEQRRGDEEVTAGLAGRAAPGVRRPQPRVRDPGRAAGHLAGPARRRGRLSRPASRRAVSSSSRSAAAASRSRPAQTWSRASCRRTSASAAEPPVTADLRRSAAWSRRPAAWSRRSASCTRRASHGAGESEPTAGKPAACRYSRAARSAASSAAMAAATAVRARLSRPSMSLTVMSHLRPGATGRHARSGDPAPGLRWTGPRRLRVPNEGPDGCEVVSASPHGTGCAPDRSTGVQGVPRVEHRAAGSDMTRTGQPGDRQPPLDNLATRYIVLLTRRDTS